MTGYTQVMDRADAMEPVDAVDYLLGIIGDLMPSVLGESHETDNWNVRVNPSERLVLTALVDAAPRWLSYDQLAAIISHQGNPDKPAVKRLVSVHVCRIRQKIGGSHGRIETMWGRGYRFVPSEDLS